MAESAIVAFEATSGGSSQDQSTAAVVSNMISALSDVTATNYVSVKPSVQAARAAYNALSTTAKAYVSSATLTKLATAEYMIAYYESAGGNSSQGGSDATTQQAMAAASTVTTMIVNLPEVTQDNYSQIKSSVEAATSAYNALSALAKSYVSAVTLAKLNTAIASIDYYEDNAPSGGGVDGVEDTEDGITLPEDSFIN